MKFVELKGQQLFDAETPFTVPYTHYYRDGDPLPGTPEADLSFIIGSDYATVLVTNNAKDVAELLDKLSEQEYNTLQNEYDYQSIMVYELHGAFVVSMEIDYLSEELSKFIYSRFIVAGAQSDDIDLAIMYVGYKHLTDKGLCFDDIEDELEAIAESEDGDQEDVECSLEFIQTILEYSPHPDMLFDILDRMKVELESV